MKAVTTKVVLSTITASCITSIVVKHATAQGNLHRRVRVSAPHEFD